MTYTEIMAELNARRMESTAVSLEQATEAEARELGKVRGAPINLRRAEAATFLAEEITRELDEAGPRMFTPAEVFSYRSRRAVAWAVAAVLRCVRAGRDPFAVGEPLGPALPLCSTCGGAFFTGQVRGTPPLCQLCRGEVTP